MSLAVKLYNLLLDTREVQSVSDSKADVRNAIVMATHVKLMHCSAH
mgnify:CR=1 FL=1